SLSTEMGRSTRVRSPALSIAAMNARRLSSAIMNGADPAGQAFEPYARESRRRESLGQRLRLGKGEHRLWQVGIGISMFRHEPADGRQNMTEVKQIHGPQRRKAGRGEFENHKARARLQDARCFMQTGVEIGQIANAEADDRAVEARRRKRQPERVGCDGGGAFCLVATALEHGQNEVGTDDAAVETVTPRKLRGEVEGAGTQIEVRAVRFRFPAEPRQDRK